jgi:pimeloyl-ACP methyl ester carboxylesterase
MLQPTSAQVPVSGDRQLDVLVAGPADGRVLLFHGGTPTAAVPFRPLIEAAAGRGLRLVTYSRPGYATSTPQPGRSVADAAADVRAIVDWLGADDFLTLGWSGGGPHALACAALLPDRCRAAVSLAGVAPSGVDGLDFLAGMADENVREFSSALAGEDALVACLTDIAPHLATVTADDVAAALGGLVPEVDKAALTGEFAEFMAQSFHKAMSTGIDGWVEDDLAFVRAWGFQLTDIRVPVAVWQGGQDRMVPFAHGQYLAGRIPNARAHLQPEEGHLSLGVASLGPILDDLLRMSSAAERADPSR